MTTSCWTSPRQHQKALNRLGFNCRVSFAIDSSGSTIGGILDEEKRAILSISKIMTQLACAQSRVLPWNSNAQNPVSLSYLDSIESYGGTEPDSLLRNPLCRRQLLQSDAWVLLTDGIIDEPDVQRFARNIARYGLHGTACIVIIFAKCDDDPASCDISVGVSLFAAVPDALFLYFDVSTRILYLLQCSGRFTQILELHKRGQPILNGDTRWADLPRVTFDDFACVSIVPPAKLSPDEILLPDGLLLNLPHLWRGQYTDTKTIDRIFRNDDNLKSIMLTAQTRGEVSQFQAWLKPFLTESSSPLRGLRDLEGRAMKSIRQIIEATQSGVSSERLRELRANVRASHSENYEASPASSALRRQRLSNAAMTRTSRGSATRAEALSSIHHDDQSREAGRHPQARSRALVTPGFKTPDRSYDMLTGECALCGDTDANLVLLLREAPAGSSGTPGFPEPNSLTPLRCPLAVGNFPETDIISSYICCDNCSYYLAQDGQTPSGEELICVLPLVTVAINREAYQRQLAMALHHRFNKEELLQVLLAIAVNTHSRLSPRTSNDAVRRAMEWVCKDLLAHVLCPTNIFSQDEVDDDDDDDEVYDVGYRPRVSSPPCRLGVLIASAFRNVYRTSEPIPGGPLVETEDLFSYPLPGFVVMFLVLQRARSFPILPYGMQNVIWQRFLYQITENYCQRMSEASDKELFKELLAQMALAQQRSQLRRDSAMSMTGQTDIATLDEISGSLEPVFAPLEALVEHGLLSGEELAIWRSLAENFDWIEKRSGPAIHLYLKTLEAAYNDDDDDTWAIFDRLRRARGDGLTSKIFVKPLDAAIQVGLEQQSPDVVRESDVGGEETD